MKIIMIIIFMQMGVNRNETTWLFNIDCRYKCSAIKCNSKFNIHFNIEILNSVKYPSSWLFYHGKYFILIKIVSIEKRSSVFLF